MNTKLHIELNKSAKIYEWLNTQADKIGARGHIGTHLDCYTSTPQKSEYIVSTHILDCRKYMPSLQLCHSLPMLNGKGLILYTGNMELNEYGSEAYLRKATFLAKETLDALMAKSPLFILIDSYGIGAHGKEHIEYDKLCENSGCYVIENIYLGSENMDTLERVKINIDIDNISTGKPCRVYKVL